ncbi:MAG: hypothetical protein ACTHNW_01555 [Mucilaginibacter sp.]
MKNNKVLDYIGMAIGFVILMALFTPSIRGKVVAMFKTKPYVELTGESSPYQLNISEFPWGYGTVAINKFSGDFDKLDEKVFDLLKGKTGICKVYLADNGTDKYGNHNSNSKYIGDIDMNELGRYQDWKFWQNGDGGIRKLLYKKLFNKSDSARLTAIDTTSAHPQPVPVINQQTQTAQRVYSFPIDRLYPIPKDRADLDTARFEEDGTIAAVNFDNGLMQIQTASELLDVQFYPLDASSDTQGDLRIALQVGNHIRSVCARAGASTLDLVAAKITDTSR